MDFSRRTPEARIWGGRTLFADRSLNPSSCWARMTGWTAFTEGLGLAAAFPRSRLFNPRAYPGWARDDEREVDIVTGCLFLIERAFWHELGGFDPRFFMFGEETDLCLRARAVGARPMITPDATIVHYDGASARDQVQKTVNLLQAAIGISARHMAGIERLVARASTIFGVALRTAAYGLAGRLRPHRYGETAGKWRAVRARRGEWRGGPPALPSG